VITLKFKYIVKPEDAGKTIKHILKKNFNFSERLIKRLKLNHRIHCNSYSVYVNFLVNNEDIVEVDLDFFEECEDILAENIPLDILFEDDCLLVLNKPPFIVVHPTSTHQSGTIANGVLYYMRSQGLMRKIRPVSRLDRDTTGIIVFAKNEYIQECLIRQMKEKTFTKEYMGIVHGHVSPASGTINLPIDRKPESIMLRHISDSGSSAVTHYEVLKRLHNATLLKFNLETGRTHQIRVHCQAIGHPLIGDTLYPYLAGIVPPFVPQSAFDLINRQALHSFKVSFTHPYLLNKVELTAPLPNDFKTLLSLLEIVGK
jgi:23S rRNA pseudouridine1911/1915/1917 synthase